MSSAGGEGTPPARGSAGSTAVPGAVAELVRALHATPQQVVLEVAGAGTQALTWLHAVAGSSRTVLEATDRYCHASLASLLGSVPASAVSAAAATAMADAAQRRARALAAAGTPVVGAACTAALATGRPRRGVDRALVAVAGALGTSVCALQFAGEPANRRPSVRLRQEQAASALLLAELAAACGVDEAVATRLAAPLGGDPTARFSPSAALTDFASGVAGCVLLDRTAQAAAAPDDWRGKVLLSGAYRPLHRGHVALGEAAADFLGREVVYELPLVNADKAPISLREAQRRAAQFAARAPLALTRAPLFAAKAALFPGAVFVVGADTAERLIDERFYGHSRSGMEAALAAIAASGCALLVAGRRVGGRYLTLDDLAARIPAPYRGLFRALPESLFRADVSSTEIRARRAAASPACR